jgi:hypothetical protein
MLIGSPVLTERVVEAFEVPSVAAGRVDTDPSPPVTASPDSIPVTLSGAPDSSSGSGPVFGVDHGLG